MCSDTKVYMTAGYQTISLGTGRKEFNPKKPRPGLEEYIKEAGQGVLKQIGGGANVDEGVIGNFMAARFNRQGNLAGLIPAIDESLRWKPCTRVEGACGSGGLALMTSIKSVLAETADVVLSLGVEVQNTVKAVYGADILAGAGWYRGERKKGHAYFFPAAFSDRAGAYFAKHGREKTRRAFARWYRNAVENAPPLRDGPGVPQHLPRPRSGRPDGAQPQVVRRPPERLRLLQGLGRRGGDRRRVRRGAEDGSGSPRPTRSRSWAGARSKRT